MGGHFSKFFQTCTQFSVCLAVSVGACATAPKAPPSPVAAEQNRSCPAFVKDSTMSVLYAPGRVIVTWAVAPSRFRDTAAEQRFVRALAKRTSQDLAALYPESSVAYAEELQGASFTVTNSDVDNLDEVRTELDDAARKFQQGVCGALLTLNPRRRQNLASATH